MPSSPLPVLLLSAVIGATAGCAGSSGAPRNAPGPTVLSAAHDPSAAPGTALHWAELGPSAFAQARAENRLVLVDGAAEWCHWCHVMEATTYHDPEVRRLLDARFVAVKVDVDARPDFEERYHEWGWPATVLLTGDGRELGRFKGYLPPEQMAEILRDVLAARTPAELADESDASGHPITPAEAAAARAFATRQLDAYWDPKQGGWGVPQKAPLGWENLWALSRARAGDAVQRDRALFTLAQEQAVVDPVWGGVSQYSTDGDWLHPHFEKLIAVQAGALASYAQAYAQTRDPRWLDVARRVRGFVDAFMTSPEGGFLATMDADLNAHDASRPFLSGHEYYAKDDAGRRALGIPRIDRHEYPRENGLCIDAYVTLHEATGDASALAAARRAATRILATHATPSGGLTHGVSPDDEGKVLYLADAAGFGLGLVHLARVTHDPATVDAARRLGAFLLHDLVDAKGGGFFGSTPDPGAVGVFAVRRHPFEDEVLAARFLAQLHTLSPLDGAPDAVARTLARVGVPAAIEDRGRKIGDLLLALDDAGL